MRNTGASANPAARPATPAIGGRRLTSRHASRPLSAAFILVLVAASPSGAQTAADSVMPDGRALIERLRVGGLVLACRHTETDRSRPDARPIEFADRSKQRNLTDRGRAQAEALGRDVRAAGVPIGEVFTSPMYRTRETAESAFGRVVITPLLWEGNNHGGQFSPLFYHDVLPGSNRVLMTHQGVLNAIPGHKRGGLAEGDCLVLAPAGDQKVTVLGALKPADWQQGTAAATGPR
jgi:hypothetical protein